MYYEEYGNKDGQLVNEAMEKKFPNCQLYEIAKSGHNYFFDMPEIVNPIISDFCK